MKKLLLASLVALSACASSPPPTGAPAPATVTSPDPAHNSRISLDWAGSYAGVLPCADCEGIKTAITLYMDGRYLRQSQYLGKSDEVFAEQGTFEWDSSGGAVTLMSDRGPAQKYQVGENQLIHLDHAGQPITGPLAPRYVLVKTL